MKTFTEAQAQSIIPKVYAFSMPQGGTHIIKAYLKENAVKKLQQQYPSVQDSDVYASNDIVSSCCDQRVLVGAGWNPQTQEHEEKYAFLLDAEAEKYL